MTAADYINSYNIVGPCGGPAVVAERSITLLPNLPSPKNYPTVESFVSAVDSYLSFHEASDLELRIGAKE